MRFSPSLRKYLFNQIAKCKESVLRFITFNQYGAGLNLGLLLENLTSAQSAFIRKKNNEQKQIFQQKNRAKAKYELNFSNIIDKMSEIISQILECEIEFKKQYFGLKTKNPMTRIQNNKSRIKKHPTFNKSISSLSHSSSSVHLNLQKDERRQIELRNTLNEKLKPKILELKSECKDTYSTTQNLYRLNEKIDFMLKDMKASYERQQKLIELFNINRIKNIHEKPLSKCQESYIQKVPENYKENTEAQDVESFLDSLQAKRKDSCSYSEIGINDNYNKSNSKKNFSKRNYLRAQKKI